MFFVSGYVLRKDSAQDGFAGGNLWIFNRWNPGDVVADRGFRFDYVCYATISLMVSAKFQP